MKKLFALLAEVLAVVSCQKDADNLDVNMGGDVATISVTLPEDAITRAVGGTDSSLGGLANTAGETIRVILKIYDEEGNPSDQRQVNYLTEDNLTTNFDVRLIPDREYTFVAWADKVDSAADVDKFYNTEDLKNVTLITNTWEAMNEGRDAFTATHTESNFTSVSNITLELKRPLAKLRVVTTDMEALRYWETEPTTATVSYATPHYTGFNAYEGKAIDRSNDNVEHQNYTIHTYTNEDGKNVKTLFTDYFFAAEGQETIQFNIAVSDQNSRLIREVAFNTEIPVKRNNLTTIQGNILTDGDKINVVIMPEFDNGSNWNPEDDNKDIKAISSNAEFAAAMTGGSGKYIVVSDNIVISASAQTLAATRADEGSNGKVISIDLNGKTIIVENNDTTNALFTLGNNDTLIFSGEGEIEGTGTGKLVNGGTVVVTGEAEVDANAVADNVVVGVDALGYVLANGGEFTFAENLTSSEILTITANNVVINGNGKTLTYTGSGENARAIVCPDTNVTNVTINDLTINCTAGFCQRGINFNNAGTLTLNNVAVSGTNVNYALNFPIGASEATVTINNSNIVGNIALNVWGSNAVFNVNNTILKSYYKSETETCPAVALNNNGTYTADGTIINIVGGEITAEVVAVENGTTTGVINISENTIVNGKVTCAVAAVHYSNTTDCHTVDSLQEAIDRMADASFPDKIVILRDFVLEESVTIAKNQTIVLDLNGKTISSVDKNVEMSSKGNFYLIDNRGTLTIKDSSADKTGAIILSAETDREWNASSVVVANNYGNLTIEGGRIEHLGGTSMAYGVDNLTNGNLGEANCTINGGHIKSTYRAVRQFLNSATDMNILTVNGGVIEGANKSIWMQDPSKNANTGTLVVNEGATLNGDVYLFVTAGSTEWPVEVSIAASAVNGEVLTGNVPEGYVVVNTNGVWTVKSGLNAAIAMDEDGILTLEDDVEISEPIVVEGREIVIDLNGKTITGTMHKNVGHVIVNNGTLTLKNGTITSAANNGGSAVMNKGTMTIENVTLNGAPNADGSWPSYTVNNTGNLTITNSNITSYHGSVASYNEGALVTLNNTNIDMTGIPGFTNHGIYTYSSGAVVVNGGEIKNNATDQGSTGGSVINGAVTVNSGDFSGRIENYYGTPVLMGGTFTVKPNDKFIAKGYKVVNNDNGTYSVVVAE